MKKLIKIKILRISNNDSGIIKENKFSKLEKSSLIIVNRYNFKTIESKWQEKWFKEKFFKSK